MVACFLRVGQAGGAGAVVLDRRQRRAGGAILTLYRTKCLTFKWPFAFASDGRMEKVVEGESPPPGNRAAWEPGVKLLLLIRTPPR